MTQPSPGHHEALDSLRSSERELSSIMAKMDRDTAQTKWTDSREHERHAYQVHAGIEVDIQHPSGSTVTYLVRPRNISRGGISFLHGNFLYPGNRCTVRLKTTDGEPSLVPGTIVRCAHVSGKVHQVGVKFEQPINLAAYLPDVDSFDDPQAETNLPRFTGTVLYVEDVENQRNLMQYMLNKLGVEMVPARTVGQALELLEQNTFAMIFVDLWLADDLAGLQLVQTLKEKDYPFPIVVTTADDDPQVHAQAYANGCTDLLIKPYDLKGLAKLLGKCLKRDRSGENEPLISKHWSQVPMRPMILSYLDDLERNVQKLERSLAKADAATMHRICRDLKGSAGSYGYPQISKLAQELETLSTGTEPVDQLQAKLDGLANLCAAACLVRRRA